MSISLEQAMSADVFHDPLARPCDDKRGPVRWRRNGQTQRWKSLGRQNDFRIPVKFGMYSYGQIESATANAEQMHTGADCPVAPEGHN